MPLSRWERKEALGHGGISRIAAVAGVSQSWVSLVLHGRRRSPRVEAAIAEAIGLPVDVVFPDPSVPANRQVHRAGSAAA
jgi:transcriptional regulator with XRE-family HTH domain